MELEKYLTSNEQRDCQEEMRAQLSFVMTFKCIFGCYLGAGREEVMTRLMCTWDVKTGSEEGKSNKEVSGALEKMGEVIDHAVINREGSKHRGTDTLRKDKG